MNLQFRKPLFFGKPFFIFFIFIFFSCGNENVNLSDIQNLNGNKISPLGHAGMGIFSQFPINSFESIVNALSHGAEGVEVDVQMTKDSVLVLYHDKTLEESTTLNGLIAERTWAEIQQGNYSNPPFAQYRIVSLQQLFQYLEDKKEVLVFLDFKLYETDQSDEIISRYWNALIKIIDQYEMADQVFIETKKRPFLLKLKLLRPDLKIFYFASFEDGFTFAKNENLFGLMTSNEAITKSQIQQAHDAGIRVCLFRLSTKEDNLEAIEKCPDFLQTDKVKHLVKVLK